MSYRSYGQQGLGDWLDDALSDWEAGYWVGAGPETSSPFWGVTGGASGESLVFHDNDTVSINGVSYDLPRGFILWTISAQFEWLRAHGASQALIDSYWNLSSEPKAWVAEQPVGPSSAEQIQAWQQEQERLNQQAQSGPLTSLLEQAKATALAGGAAARDALQFLSEHGDFFAKIALGLGVGYGAAMAVAAAAAGITLVVFLKK